METPLQVLQSYWGFPQFKPSQEEVISSVITSNDTVALLPTGGGKSLCFQIPALSKEGICIVISPLIALMQDQVQALKAKNIKAMAITSGISYTDLDTALDNCIYGNYKFLYLSPERLQQDIVKERIKCMNVNLIAIDEAHCISQWGHDFRPAYLNVNILRELHPSIPIIALTATATQEVVKDVISQLDLYQPKIIKQSFKRDNIAFKTKKLNDKYGQLLDEVRNVSGSIIIYLRNRRATQDISSLLTSKGFRATNYHGGITNEEKHKRLSAWLNNETQIMVATNAFGMGIDKADVRKVIHFNFSESIESYFQEAGRAGRDGKLSEAIIIYNESDHDILNAIFLKNLPTVETVKHIYAKLNSYLRIAYGEGQDEVFSFNFNMFCQQYQLNTHVAYGVLQLLDRTSVLQLTKQFKETCSVQFLLSNNQLLYFIEQSPKYEHIIKAILRSYGGIFEAPITINLQQIVNKAGSNQKEAVQLLNELDDREIISFEFSKHDAAITFLVPREDAHTINPLVPYIKQQYETKQSKIKAFLNFVENDTICKSVQLLRYFGETETKPCGLCNVCVTGNTSKLNKNTLIRQLMSQIKAEAKSVGKLSEELKQPKKEIIKLLSLLISEDLIIRTPEQTYKAK